ncbi:MAG: hypothetical protein HY548_02610 [Elusimicrobia bacterium]|nr:hypothetical protein [Elusimicrobiota bacterium]
MKLVSAAYKAMQQSSEIRPARKIELFRRFSSGNGWEAAPIDVTAEVVSLDRLSWKLDADELNEFKASNLRLEVDNSARLWDGTSSRFNGFLLYRSKVRVSLGLKPGATEEIFSMFTGVIEEVNQDSRRPVLQITLKGMDVFLETRTAEGAGLLVTNESIGTGDGVKADFFTGQNGVGLIKEVRVAGVVSRPGKHYTVSQLNEGSRPAKITFSPVQPGPGQEVRVDYIRWKTQQEIHQVVQDLLALVPEVQVDKIEPVTFPDPSFGAEVLHTLEADFNAYNLVQAKVVPEPAPPSGDGAITLDPIETQAEWQSGTASGINFTQVPDAITATWPVKYEADGMPNQEPGWNESDLGTSDKKVENGLLSFSLGDTNAWIFENLAGFVAKRSLYWRMKWSPNGGTFEVSSFFAFGSSRGARVLFTDGFHLQIEGAGVVPLFQESGVFHSYRLELDDDAGTWRFRVDGTEKASGLLGSIAGSVNGFRTKAFGVQTTEIDYLRMNSDTQPPVGTWEKVVDYTVHLPNIMSFAQLDTLGSFFVEVNGNASDVTFKYAFSADGFNFDPEQTVENGGNLGAFNNVTLRQFLKFKIEVRGSEGPTPSAVRRLLLPGLALSPVIDPGTSPIFWERWRATFDLNGGNVRRFTAHRANNLSGFSFYRAVGSGDEITSDELARAQGTAPDELLMIILLNPAGLTPPLFRETLLSYSTTTVLLSMANLGTRKVLDVVKEVAKLADYEIGVNGEGKFFFRNKSSSTAPVAVLDESNILEVSSLNPGWDRVFNRIEAHFGSFSFVVNSQTEGDPPPTSNDQYEERSLSVGGGSLMFNADVDLATSLGRRYYRRYKDPKKRGTLVLRYMPELEPGDPVAVRLGQPDFLAQSFNARILGLAHDDLRRKTEASLREG